ncbi:MAG: protein kinase [Candidatus Aminicenantes bacterium]|nr:protein kinase [Candidatus Aminicenantes bacterium]
MIGRTLLHYRIVEEIGRGGMGVVYKAIDTHLDRPVAIKVLPPDKLADPERKRRFVLEAKAASALHHPNIVVIHDIASDQGQDFIVMEYVDGASLDTLIGRRGLKLGPALGYAVQIADGLARAHAAGIVHRDLKPTNVMVAAGGLVKILDFGLAKLAEPASDAEQGRTMTLTPDDKPRTEEGFIVGTAAYMSPEQAEGGTIDARSDIFSFGVLLYEMLTGQKAFQRDSRIKTLAAVLNEEPRPASSVNETLPPDAERILTRCLRKDPARRWQTASDLKVALVDLKEDSESGKLPAAVRPARAGKRPSAVRLAGLVLILAAAAAVLRLAVFKPVRAIAYETTRLTFDTGLTMTPTISPDGKFVVYTSDREGTGTMDLWMQQISGGKPLRLTDDPANDWYPCFSPDGTKIAFRSERDGGGIFVIDALGGVARRIADRGSVPRFSPDGSLISFISVPGSLESGLFDIFLVPAAGGTPRPFHPEFRFSRAQMGAGTVWAPDGSALLVHGARDNDPASVDWWVLPIDGGAPIRTGAVANLGLELLVHYPEAWRKEGVYYISGTTIEGVNIFRAPIDAKTRVVSGPAVPLTSGPGMKIGVTVAGDGLLAYSAVTAGIDAWSVSARSDQGVVSTDLRKVTHDLMQKYSPAVSRDGKQIAFIAFGGVKGAKLEVRRMDFASGRETVFPCLTLGMSFNHYPRFSPGGSLLAYRDSFAGKLHTFVVPAGAAAGRDVGAVGKLLDFFSYPDFALVQADAKHLVKRRLSSGEQSVVLALQDGFFGDGSLSPDDRWAVYRAGLPDGRVSIAITPVGPAPASPSGIIPVAVSDRYVSNPRWSPNGGYVYFLSERDGRCRLYAQKLDPRSKKPQGEAQAVFTSPGERINLNYPMGNGFIDVAADKIIFTVDEASGNIVLLTPKK